MLDGFTEARCRGFALDLLVRHIGAGPPMEYEHVEADRATGRPIASQVLMLYSEDVDLEDLHGDPLAIWRTWAARRQRAHDRLEPPDGRAGARGRRRRDRGLRTASRPH